jgi:glycosyltransferase involved in cell wall biosynthesis
MNVKYPGKLALLQRVLPTYRAPFFDMLADACQGGLSLCAGKPRPSEAIETTEELRTAHLTHARNIHLLRGALYLCFQAGLPAWLASEDPDALIVEANPRYLSTPAAVRWMKERGRPVIGWGLGSPPLSGAQADMRRTTRLKFVRQFDALLTYSQRGASEYQELGYPAERIFVAPNAVAPRPQHILRERPPFFKERASILFVGRLQRRKRLDLLLLACASLPQEMRPHLVIVGDGPERRELEGLAGEVYPSAEFAGAKHGADLAPLFAEADLFVLPGSGGLAVQEAMSHALPVIVAEGDGTQDDLISPDNGWQIPPDDLSALSKTLRSALSDVARLRKMGMESHRIVLQEINLERMVEVFVEVLNRYA